MGYIYTVRLAPTSISAAKTLIQIKPVNAVCRIVDARVYQTSKTSTEFLALQLIQYTGSPTAGTVTSATPIPANANHPAALAIGGTSATGVNATVEPSGGTANIIFEDVWNVVNGSYPFIDLPEARIEGSVLLGLKLNTAPAAAMTIGAVLRFEEWR